MRAFIALELPDLLKRRLAEVRRGLECTDAKVKWVRPEAMHLTVRFLGDIDERQAEALARAVRDEAAHWSGPIRLAVGGLGAFPNRRNPRVIWVGTGAHPGLHALAERMERAAVAAGLAPAKRRFSAHLTLGRVKYIERGDPLLDRLRSVQVETFHYEVGALALIESELAPDGPRYTPVERVEFAGSRDESDSSSET
ncbi:MAG: RNA 2',3'-cyclic phosphodiesterase [Calditrichaeota bacterium]|nr:RNA 2',3'-cyclic phosphodiesterase [Calditrichota bacterium]